MTSNRRPIKNRHSVRGRQVVNAKFEKKTIITRKKYHNNV